VSRYYPNVTTVDAARRLAIATRTAAVGARVAGAMIAAGRVSMEMFRQSQRPNEPRPRLVVGVITVLQ